jgi:hypothetical protein
LIQNHYAHKFKNTIINIEDTITQESYFAEKSKLKVTEAPQGHKTTLYFDSSHKYPIGFLHFDIPDSIEIFKVDIEFMIYLIYEKNDAELMSAVVMNIPKVSYKSDNLKIDKQNQWYTYKKTLTYKKELWEHAEGKPYLTIYLWNKGELEGYIDDIKVKVITD